jgi:hypothetical protein
MSTTVPYWSNMQTLMEALTSSACAIRFLRSLWRAIAIIKTNRAHTANHVDPPLCRLAEAALMRLRVVRLRSLLHIEIHRDGVTAAQ